VSIGEALDLQHLDAFFARQELVLPEVVQPVPERLIGIFDIPRSLAAGEGFVLLRVDDLDGAAVPRRRPRAGHASSRSRFESTATAVTRYFMTPPRAYVDDGISGAEFEGRPALLRMMNALKPRPAFDAIVMPEESRLGREAIETAYALKQIISAGVRVFFYLENRERTFETATDKLLMSVTAFADEFERETVRQRFTDAMQRKAHAGHVCGGRTFGYDNLEVLGPDGKRSHVERRIHDGEAAIVRRIFALCAAGTGYARIAKVLNAEGAPSPRPQLGRPAGWSPSTINVVLHRSLYRGEIIWNKSRKRDQWGRQRQRPRAAVEWMRREVPGCGSCRRPNGRPSMTV
jgi:DNA invertase Pin-like site-specific DNA recombinase